MYSLQKLGPRLWQSKALCLAGARRWKRTMSVEARALQALLGPENEFARSPPSSSSPSSQSSSPPFSQKLRSSLEALVRHQTNSDNLIETLKSTSLPAEIADDSSPPSSKRKKKKKKEKGATTQQEESRHAEEPSAYDETSRLTTEHWTGDWGVDKLAPPSDDQSQSSSPRKYTSNTHRRPPIPYKRRIEGLLEDAHNESVLTDLDPISEQHSVATLAHGLDRVLFNPGVHWLQDPRSHVYNFTPWLEKIPKVNDFAFERLVGFIKSSRDNDLWEFAKRENRTFVGSTSSLTKLLSHIYFLISEDKEVDISNLSHAFASEPRTFTPGQRMPASVVLRYQDGVYAIDSDSDSPEETDRNILTWLGTLLEKFLTFSPQDFKRYLRSSSPEPEDLDPKREAYRYAKSERFVMRSQLDCHDPRLPGTGVFDIKTRAVLPIRLDVLNYEENSGYLIRTLQGPLESFEKEYYDLIRSAFLKYSFQARIGNMDGVLVAYHNTARLFGFQYVPLEEMDERLFGSAQAGPRVFEKCLSLLEAVAEEVIKTYPQQSLRCMFETLEGSRKMNIWVQPLAAEPTSESQDVDVQFEPVTPIKQLEVTATNYLAEVETRGANAINGSKGANWSIYWTISTLADSEHDIRERYEAAKDRQFRDFLLPSGVTKETVQELWDKLNFRTATSSSNPPTALSDQNNESAASDVANHPALTESSGSDGPTSTVDPDLFRKPGRNIKFLRSVARAGREHSTMMAEQRKGMPKIVWGEAKPWVDGTDMPEEALTSADVQTPEQQASDVDAGGNEVAAVTLEAFPETLSDGVEVDAATDDLSLSNGNEDGMALDGQHETGESNIMVDTLDIGESTEPRRTGLELGEKPSNDSAVRTSSDEDNDMNFVDEDPQSQHINPQFPLNGEPIILQTGGDQEDSTKLIDPTTGESTQPPTWPQPLQIDVSDDHGGLYANDEKEDPRSSTSHTPGLH